MNKKTKKEIIKEADDLLSFDIIFIFSNLVYGLFMSILFFLLIIAIKSNLIEGYFQNMVFMVMIVFCVREAYRHFSKFQGVWSVIGLSVFLYFILLALGYDTLIFQVMVVFSFFLVITKITYHLGFREYLIKKFRLTKQDVLEIKKDQK